MKFRERLKRDKKFRIFFILITLFIISQIGNMTPKQALTESQCNAIFEDNVNWWCWIICWPLGTCGTCLDTVTEEMFNECQYQGCHVQTSTNADWPLGSDTWLECLNKWIYNDIPFAEKCTAAVPVGKYVYDDPYGCASYEGLETGDLCGHTIYKCLTSDPETQCENSFQASLAGMLDSFWEDSGMRCKTKYYIVLFGGGFLALMMILAVI